MNDRKCNPSLAGGVCFGLVLGALAASVAITPRATSGLHNANAVTKAAPVSEGVGKHAIGYPDNCCSDVAAEVPAFPKNPLLGDVDETRYPNVCYPGFPTPDPRTPPDDDGSDIGYVMLPDGTMISFDRVSGDVVIRD